MARHRIDDPVIGEKFLGCQADRRGEANGEGERNHGGRGMRCKGLKRTRCWFDLCASSRLLGRDATLRANARGKAA